MLIYIIFITGVYQYISVYASVFLFIYLSIYLSIYLPTYLSICIYLSICKSEKEAILRDFLNFSS